MSVFIGHNEQFDGNGWPLVLAGALDKIFVLRMPTKLYQITGYFLRASGKIWMDVRCLSWLVDLWEAK